MWKKKFAKKWRMTYSNFFVEKSFCRKKNGGLRSQFFFVEKSFWEIAESTTKIKNFYRKIFLYRLFFVMKHFHHFLIILTNYFVATKILSDDKVSSKLAAGNLNYCKETSRLQETTSTTGKPPLLQETSSTTGITGRFSLG